MAISIQDKSTILPESIIIGHAQLTAVYKRNKLHWALPGGGYTASRPFAMMYASRMNKLIRVNMKRYSRTLLWS